MVVIAVDPEDLLPVLVNGMAVGVHQPELGILFEESDLFLDLLRGEEIVAVQEGNVFAMRRSNPQIQRRRLPLVHPPGVLQNLDAVGIALEHFAGVVGAPVIDDDQLDIGVCLVEDAFDGLGDVLAPVVAGNNDADFRQSIHDLFTLPASRIAGFFIRNPTALPCSGTTWSAACSRARARQTVATPPKKYHSQLRRPKHERL